MIPGLSEYTVYKAFSAQKTGSPTTNGSLNVLKDFYNHLLLLRKKENLSAKYFFKDLYPYRI